MEKEKLERGKNIEAIIKELEREKKCTDTDSNITLLNRSRSERFDIYEVLKVESLGERYIQKLKTFQSVVKTLLKATIQEEIDALTKEFEEL